MENKLKQVLGVSQVKATGYTGGGCISQGEAFETENGKIFLKSNSKPEAKNMFEGELAGLNAILSTKTVKVPKPITIFDSGSGSNLVMEYVDMSSLRKHAGKLGEQLARMHLHNKSLQTDSNSLHKSTEDEAMSYVEEFGFHTTTCCGYLPLDNSWNKDWLEFYVQQRLGKQLQLIESEYGDRNARELWSELQLKIPMFFKDVTVTPALLHGDLWSGNVAQTDDEPVIFDPATFYGHSEFELAIADMFGRFPNSFYEAYHGIIPMTPGFPHRKMLYQLFHYLNHWNHFGSGYKSSSISTMKRLLEIK